MPDYRIYTVTNDGRIHGVPTIVSCADDREATAKARQFVHDASIDVWERDRRVARISPDGTTLQEPRSEPDPLTHAMREAFGWFASRARIEKVRQSLTAHGVEIKGQGER